eukprot:9482355-Pyramimonas_sp.AAC.1
MVGDDGNEICRISCPLWAPNLQTAQGGEFGAYAVAAMHAMPGSSIYSGCKNVVVQANEPLLRALSYQRVHSGFLLPTHRKLLDGVFKVNAHVGEPSDLTELERFWKQGNDIADVVAKSTLARHPQPDPEDVEWLERCLSIAQCVMRLAAELMPEWPRLNLTGVALVPKPPRPKIEPGPHQWTRVSSFWQCINVSRSPRACRGRTLMVLGLEVWTRLPLGSALEIPS